MIQPSELRAALPSELREPRAFFAPGRVNFIGEHTDYNDGFVLPLALELGITVLGSARQDSMLHVASVENGQTQRISIDLKSPGAGNSGSWRDYVEGIARELLATGHDIAGADLVLASDLPTGAGLSSSAALEMAVGFALLSLANIPVNLVDLALAGQKAEHHWVGTRCGIMDQLASACAREGSALLIDCRSLEFHPIPLLDSTTSILVADTRVKHSLANSAYNQRREECEAAVNRLREAMPTIRALRDVSSAEFAQHGHLLERPQLERARHVITENERVQQAAKLLENRQFESIGPLLVASHRSLQHDYQVSCAQLDLLVDTAIEQPGVLGARMTGGGFGGSIVCLVRTSAVETVKSALARAFSRTFGHEPGFIVTKGGRGVGEIL
jgi:galactokinase